MHTVQIQLKSRDFRIPGFHLDLKIVYEFQLWSSKSYDLDPGIIKSCLQDSDPDPYVRLDLNTVPNKTIADL
jgi:hypothetical protein